MPVVFEDDPAVMACLDRSRRRRERCTPAGDRLTPGGRRSLASVC
jgi:hypothetical protein